MWQLIGRTLFTGRWVGFAVGCLAGTCPLAVPILAVSFLTRDVPLASEPGVAATDMPVAFDAPTWAVRKAQASDQEIRRSLTALGTSAVPEEIIPLDAWNYTAIVRGLPQPSGSK